MPQSLSLARRVAPAAAALVLAAGAWVAAAPADSGRAANEAAHVTAAPVEAWPQAWVDPLLVPDETSDGADDGPASCGAWSVESRCWLALSREVAASARDAHCAHSLVANGVRLNI